jgi:hypothetical protein
MCRDETPSVFIRTTRNASGQAYYHLVESYRDEGTVRQRTLLSLGRVEDGQLEQLAAAIAKHTQMCTALDLAKSVDVESTYVLGPLLVLQGLFQRLGIDEVIERVQSQHPRLGMSLRQAVFSLTVARFIRPSSKLAVYEQLLGSLYPAMLGAELKLHQLYRTLDVLATAKDDIETSLFAHGRDLFTRQVDVVLYDLTTLRFESTHETEQLRRFGFSFSGHF